MRAWWVCRAHLFVFCNRAFSTANFNLLLKPRAISFPREQKRVGLVHYSHARQTHRPSWRNEATVSYSSAGHCSSRTSRYGARANIYRTRVVFTKVALVLTQYFQNRVTRLDNGLCRLSDVINFILSLSLSFASPSPLLPSRRIFLSACIKTDGRFRGLNWYIKTI